MKLAFPALADESSNVLILGTIPGEKSLALQQYYGNRQNQFWKLMFAIYGQPLADNYKERIALLRKHRIALWDVLAGCQREGSLDSNIKNAVANDFDTFYKQHPNITTVFFSSKVAEKFYMKLVGKREGITYYALPSPSGANASLTFAQKFERWTLIRAFAK
jgi:hypoxanthine-DNA glycosylase